MDYELLMVTLGRQFIQRHGRRPRRVVLTPEALAAMAIKRSALPQLDGAKVICRDIAESELTTGDDAVDLGGVVQVRNGTAYIVGCSLKG